MIAVLCPMWVGSVHRWRVAVFNAVETAGGLVWRLDPWLGTTYATIYEAEHVGRELVQADKRFAGCEFVEGLDACEYGIFHLGPCEPWLLKVKVAESEQPWWRDMTR